MGSSLTMHPVHVPSLSRWITSGRPETLDGAHETSPTVLFLGEIVMTRPYVSVL